MNALLQKAGELPLSGGTETRGADGGGGRVSTLVRRLSLVLPRSCKATCHNSPPYLRARSISEEFSSGDTRFREGGGEDGQPTGPHGTSSVSSSSTPHGAGGKVDKAAREREERDEEVVKVYDGNNSMRRRIFRPVTIPRLTSTDQLLSAAMRAFHITKDPGNFYLTDAYSPDETVLADPLPLQSVIRKEGKRPALFLRFKDSEIDCGEVNVYPGKLQLNSEQQTRLPVVKVDGNSTAGDVIREALVQFGLASSLEEAPVEDYRLSEILLDRGAVTERVLAVDERPWERVKRTGRDSIRQMELMRFYLQQKQDPHGPNLALFVGNLPPNLSQRNYENLLTDFLGKENKFSSIGPIYYEYGSMVITYEDSSKAVRALYILRESNYEDKHLLDYKILVCGGDGTIGWVLQCLDNVGQDSECSSPPCAIVPLGTGNDLARVLRWGPGYTGGEDPLNLLRDIIDAEEIRLDRWTVVFHPEDKASSSSSSGDDKTGAGTAGTSGAGASGIPQQQLTNSTAGSTSEDNTQIFVMNNYFGIGIDADLCLDFHNAREENPNKFNSSWGSGANPWGPEKEDQFSKPNHWDGMLEVVGVTGVVHLGQIQSGLRSAMRIAQGGHIKIHLHTDIPVQVDGEPWVQSPGDVVVLKSALKATMLKKTKGKIKRRNTEPSMVVSPMAAQYTLRPQDSSTNHNTAF
ncbi:hypothetical protein J437_LFUL006065 [Ladona fulva]|uniref:Diacylglycerol kinase n=1 Tax=Ladona fulva TaxID=123851 RepID=A0A8K0JZG1_LADFU|nr:hypothetical protein J437_LFUL006065 [Ladona fulva]